MKALLLVAWLVTSPQRLEAIEILGLFQSVGRSQWVLAEAYLRALESRGHAITAVTTFPSSQGNSNTWTEVLIPNAFTAGGDVNFFELRTRSKWELRIESRELGEALCESFLADEGVQRLYRSGQKFDLVVLELLMTECLLGFAHLFGAPVVALSSFIGVDFIGHMVGNPWPYALVPSTLVTYGCRMSFLERLNNAIQSTAINLLRSLDYMPRVEAIFRRHVNASSLPSLAELERRTALLLVNHHFSHGCPRPLVPAMVEVGGLHIREPQKLPQDLQKFLDEATDGVVYFSMGSNVKSKHWPAEKRRAFVEVFSGLQQRVLWKWEDDALPGQPGNVRIEKWLPQADILAHRNVRAFISHGGLLSVQEAMARGVPMVTLPLFAELELNSNMAASQGMAMVLQLHNVSTSSVQWALDEVLHNPRYRESARRLSRIFSDRPLDPLDEAVYWTEYVARHRGAAHMRSAALGLAWFQYWLLDVVAVAAAAAAVLLLAAALATRAVLRLLCGAKAHTGNKSKRGKAQKRD